MRLVIDLQGTQSESQDRGIGRQSRMLVQAMIRHAGRHDVAVVLNESLPNGLDALYREFSSTLGVRNVHVFSTPEPSRESDLGNLWRMRSGELIREAFLAGLRPDVVYLTSLFEGMNDDAVTSIGLLETPYATAVTLFDLIPLYDPDRYLNAQTARNFYYRRAQSLKRADLLLAISASARQEAEEMLAISPERIEVSLLAAGARFHPVRLAEAAEALLRAKYQIPGPFILYVGAIEERKNVGMILEGFARLPAALQAGHHVVFGGRLHPPERLQLRAKAVRCGVDPNKLIFPGFVAEADLPALYSMCSLFIFPSMHEGFGLPPLEAMACGAPVLAARNSSLPEVMGRDDLLFDTFDADELAARMRRLLAEPDDSAAMRQWGPERAASFSWDKAGQDAVAALERLHDRHRKADRRRSPLRRRKRLAFLSPLPSDRSGIANYSVELLKELACFYEIECVIEGTIVTDPWVLANFVLRDVSFFKRHVNSYDRVIYCVGNSSFHTHMFPLLEMYPGVVILHDFFLSGIHDWLGNTGKAPPEDFVRELYLTHGISALRVLADEGRDAAAARFAANRVVFHHALGTVLHSRWAVEAAQELYGDAIASSVALVPQLRAPSPSGRRDAARRRLGIGHADVMVCSFGFLAATKLNDRLLSAWADTRAAKRPRARLVFVGENCGGAWAAQLSEAIAAHSGLVSVTIAGFVEPALYDDYLAAADLAVQLRTASRGETSRAILDCLAAGLPLIVNAHGSAAELPDDAVRLLPDAFTDGALKAAIDELLHDPEERQALGRRGRSYLQQVHHPAVAGRALAEAVELFYQNGSAAERTCLLDALTEVQAPCFPTEHDHAVVANVLTRNSARPGLRKLFFDVTLLAAGDAHSGIERIVRSMLLHLIDKPPPRYQVELVRITGNRLVYARAFAARRLGLPADVLPDSEVDYDAGDLYLGLEWAAGILPDFAEWLQRFRRYGGRVIIGINDLLPLTLPHHFPVHIGPIAERWFETVLEVADQLVCISRTVADEVIRFGCSLTEGRNTPIAVDFYHCAADIEASIPTVGMPAQARSVLAGLARRPTFLMVGTVEPRKGHLQVLDAFRALWAAKLDVGLVVVGRKGWMVETAADQMSSSPEKGIRLHWLEDVSDEFLVQLYSKCTALLAASENEGFGLPLVEAASYNLSIIARDIPVFREVAGNGAFFFQGRTGTDLASALRQWLTLRRLRREPKSFVIQRRTWVQAAADLKERLLSQDHYGKILPREITYGSDKQWNSVV